MLTIQQIKENKEVVMNGLKKKNFADLSIIDEILNIDQERRKLQQKNDDLAANLNLKAKEVGALMAKGEKDKAESQKLEIATIKEQQKNISQSLSEYEETLRNKLVSLPNIPHNAVPNGKTQENNEIVRQVPSLPELTNDALPHWELTKKYNLIDFELGTKLTGSGFPVYIHQGAQLQRALINYFIQYNTAAGYTEYLVPHMVNEDSAYGTGQLPDKEGQMYHATVDNFYLIPTAEVPLTNIYRDQIVDVKSLPIKMTGYTPCFRREAGSYGKDVRGLNRLHQFDKVEIVEITKPEESYDTLERMVTHVEQLLRNLGLPYRVLRLCGGDMSFASALTYDFEVWSAAQKRWLEVSSVSNFETFQTNRMKIRYKNQDGKIQLLHSLNGSSLALPRIVACILENNQKEDGIHLPEVLQPFLSTLVIK